MKYKLLPILLLALQPVIIAQQFTTVAVVDISKIFTFFYRETAELREVEEKEKKFSQELEVLRNRSSDLQRKRFEEQQAGNRSEVARLDAEIKRITEYSQSLNAQYKNEINEAQKKLLSDDFYRNLQESIRVVSEQNGYTLVLRKDTAGLQWWSAQVDISDLIVKHLVENRQRAQNSNSFDDSSN